MQGVVPCMTKGRVLEAGGTSSLNENVIYETESPCSTSKLFLSSYGETMPRMVQRSSYSLNSCHECILDTRGLNNHPSPWLWIGCTVLICSLGLARHLSDKSHSTLFSLKNFSFLYKKNKEQYTLVHSNCNAYHNVYFKNYLFSKQEKDVHSSNNPTAPMYKNLQVSTN